MKTILLASALAAATALGAGSALAATTAAATTDLNIRTGPGPQYPPTGVIASGDSVTIDGCLENSQWCQVSYNGTTGWSYAQYLTSDYEGQSVVVQQRRTDIGVPAVTYEAPADSTVTVDQPVAGELLGRVEDVPAVAPPPPVRTYVTENPVDPVYLNGEVVVGAGVPDTVKLIRVPDTDYDYVYVNGQPVLVDPNTHRIVHVYR